MRYLKSLSIVLVCLSLQGCVMFFGNWGALGYGKRTVEYNEDRTVKKEITESKSLLADIVNFVFNKGE
ncbi:hypothetical protein LCGC14_2544830 [marine sediment metagenome]|uniref:Uncharacterized protein n=1 Tax=marine sediment metagenome TaxID=412755 RepID=A0A0F9D155_9ZZZZ